MSLKNHADDREDKPGVPQPQKQKAIPPDQIPTVTPQDLEKAGYDLDATPKHMANCNLTEQATKSATANNKSAWERYQSALQYGYTPHPPQLPLLSIPPRGKEGFKDGYYYYEIQDPNARQKICENDEEVPLNPGNKDFNFNSNAKN